MEIRFLTENELKTLSTFEIESYVKRIKRLVKDLKLALGVAPTIYKISRELKENELGYATTKCLKQVVFFRLIQRLILQLLDYLGHLAGYFAYKHLNNRCLPSTKLIERTIAKITEIENEI